jgi:hypothetical protein
MEASKAAAIVAAEDCVDAAAERVFERNMLWLFLCPLCLSQVTDVRYLGEVTCERLGILLTRTRAEIWLRGGRGGHYVSTRRPQHLGQPIYPRFTTRPALFVAQLLTPRSGAEWYEGSKGSDAAVNVAALRALFHALALAGASLSLTLWAVQVTAVLTYTIESGEGMRDKTRS